MMSSNASAEKEKYPIHRKFIRHKIRVKVEVQMNESYQTWTNNISEDGTCFEIPRQLPVGREVVLWVYLPSNKKSKREEPVRARCRIVWHDKGKKAFAHGGQFLFFIEDGEERLKTFLTELARPITQPPPP